MIFVLLMSTSYIYAFTWDDCIDKYNKAKQFSDNIKLSYLYLKGTKNCLIKFKNLIIQNPNPEFTVEAMSDNIVMLEEYMEEILPSYTYPNNNLEQIPKYVGHPLEPSLNQEYQYFKKFNNCNGVHAQNKIYTAKHCKIKNSKNIRYDLNYIESKEHSQIKVSKLDFNKKGTFKYYSMSKEGMFYSVLLEEKNCKFYKVKNNPSGLNTTLDLTDLEKKDEIRSSCLAIPSNSGGGVFQDGKLVGIISKTVFNKKEFLYSIVEPIKGY